MAKRSTMKSWFAVFAACGALWGCGLSVNDPEVTGGELIKPDPSEGGAAPGVTPVECGVPGEMIDTMSQEDVETRLVRQWAYCSGFQLFTPHDGLEFAADGNFYFLRRDETGALKRIGGFDGGGNWSILDITGMNGPGELGYQINMDTSSGGNGVFAFFQIDPVAMRLSTMVGPIDYVAVTSE